MTKSQIELSLLGILNLSLTVRTANGPQTMATLRNLAVSLLRLHGHKNLAQATRYYNAHRAEVLHLIGA